MKTTLATENTAPTANSGASWLRAVRNFRQESWRGSLAGYLFIAPALILYLTFNAYPIIRGLIIAFSDYRYLIPGHEPFNGLDNWKEMVHDRVFWEALRRSAEYALIFMTLNFLIAFFVAVLISQIKGRRESSVYRVIVYLPYILPIAIALPIWNQLLSPQFGYIDYFLHSVLHLPLAPDFLHSPGTAIPILAVVAVWRLVGYNILLLLIGLYNINSELYEAAAIDGAGWWQQLFRITIPLLRPTFTFIFVLGAGVLGVAQESLVFFGVTSAGPGGAGRLVGRYAYELAFLQGDLRWGYAAAINLTVGLISICVSLVVFRLLRSGRIS